MERSFCDKARPQRRKPRAEAQRKRVRTGEEEERSVRMLDVNAAGGYGQRSKA